MITTAIRYACGHGDWHDTYAGAQNDPGTRPPTEHATDEQLAQLRALLAADTPVETNR
ncbi:hypothetical protein [Williamsia sp. CHRR-6]|uniref:hypothetical protein n=1 Tax=Williamsia sp. CHRR-6 TaxID=2835871 RepID=UPI001BDA5AE2|nr:hypothetical protein [Williamsia sp. CHRR-6]MBT0568591.1 hypothetical protein [Williamsia sp. CHRR-6]